MVEIVALSLPSVGMDVVQAAVVTTRAPEGFMPMVVNVVKFCFGTGGGSFGLCNKGGVLTCPDTIGNRGVVFPGWPICAGFGINWLVEFGDETTM